MPVQPQLWQLNPKKHPHSYFLLRKIMEHKNMNIGKPNEDLISTKALLSVCGTIPSYDEMRTGARQVTKRIIDPFERDMNALADTLTWEYCHKSGSPLTDKELETFDYQTFSNTLILIHWNSYPEQSHRLEAAAERRAKKTPSPKRRNAYSQNSPADQS